MTVLDLYKKIEDMITNGDLSWNSPVTVHAYVGDGETIEWRDNDIMIESYGSYDGLEINVDAENTGIV